jgi:hypothetical protein
MMAAAQPVDLSAVRSALWLAAPTLLALLVIYFVGVDQGAVSVFGGGLLRRNERHLHRFEGCALMTAQVQVQENRYAPTRVEGWKVV